MDFMLTPEQQQLRDVARRALAAGYPPERITAAAARGTDPDAWPLLAQLGWLDTDLVDRAVLAEECGYALLPTPWWSALALPDPPERPVALADGAFSVGTDAGGLRLTATAADVPDVLAASTVLISDGVRAFEVAVADCELTPVDGVDPLRRSADLACTAAPAIERAPAPAPRVGALLAAEAVGVARRAFDLAVGHARTREQFGRPIGAYQGVSFPLTECYILIEAARSLAYRAAWQVAHEESEAGLAVAMALPAGREAAVTTAEQAIQTLGGIGMTWDHPLHHWYRRALWLQAYGAADEECLDQVATAVLETR